jgi:hypothetical protein
MASRRLRRGHPTTRLPPRVEEDLWDSRETETTTAKRLLWTDGNLSEEVDPARLALAKTSLTPSSPSPHLREQGPMTLDQIEEHGLVLAIQAAHHASRLQQQHISSYSSSAGGGANFHSPGASRDSDREEAGLGGLSYSSSQLSSPRERKVGNKFLSRSRSLPSERESSSGGGGSSEDSDDGYVHVEEKPSAELFLVGLSLFVSRCALTVFSLSLLQYLGST